MILAQIAGGYSLMHLLILIIVVGAAIGITLVVLKQSGIVVPAFIVTIGWIVLAAAVGIFAIRLVMGM